MKTLRPCLVNGRKALFHRWHEHFWTVPAEVTIGGRPAGQMSRTLAIVEFEDGSVEWVNPADFRFLDHHFAEYCWEEDGHGR